MVTCTAYKNTIHLFLQPLFKIFFAQINYVEMHVSLHNMSIIGVQF
jgi:hypothetical protein